MKDADWNDFVFIRGNPRGRHVEWWQQGKATAELNAQWERTSFWTGVQGQLAELDALIDDFNGRSGLAGN